jgi:hypothetical protein
VTRALSGAEVTLISDAAIGSYQQTDGFHICLQVFDIYHKFYSIHCALHHNTDCGLVCNHTCVMAM